MGKTQPMISSRLANMLGYCSAEPVKNLKNR